MQTYKESKMIKYAILGFLMYNRLTGYDIKQFMNKSTSNFMNASFGSIYPALNSLEKQNMITSSNTIENGKYKKTYEINSQGKELFLKWLEEPIDFMRSYEGILIKVFFYRFLSSSKQEELFEKLINDINIKIVDLEGLALTVTDEAGYFEMSTLDFGIDHLKFMKQWYQRFLNKIKNKTEE